MLTEPRQPFAPTEPTKSEPEPILISAPELEDLPPLIYNRAREDAKRHAEVDSTADWPAIKASPQAKVLPMQRASGDRP